jgi:predicted GIY-YIG superfamily endonuclease
MSLSTQTQRRTALYRLFATDGRLLYIGIAYDPDQRWQGHSDKIWWTDVTEKTVDWFDSREEAATAEIAAIGVEKPLYNKADSAEPYPGHVIRPDRKASRIVRAPDDAWDAYGKACASKGTNRADDLRRHMTAEIKAWQSEQRRIAAEQRAVDS